MWWNPWQAVRWVVERVSSIPDAERSVGESEPDLPVASTPVETFTQTGMAAEEFVAQLLRWNGGRMHQQDVVEETGWAASTVSRWLSQMEANGTVVRARVGRRKVVGLPERMPTPDSRSTHASSAATRAEPGPDAAWEDPEPARVGP